MVNCSQIIKSLPQTGKKEREFEIKDFFRTRMLQFIRALVPQKGSKHFLCRPQSSSDSGKYTIIYRVLYIPGGAGFLPSTVWVKAFICFKKINFGTLIHLVTAARKTKNAIQLMLSVLLEANVRGFLKGTWFPVSLQVLDSVCTFLMYM